MRCFAEALAARAVAAVPRRRRAAVRRLPDRCIPSLPERPSDNRIELTADDLRQLEVAWTAQWHRPPTPEEMRGLVEGRVREEILYREALALGLDRGDTIVKRRLAQKMEFLAERCLGAARSNRRRIARVVCKELGTLCRAWPPIVPTRVLFHGSARRPGARRMPRVRCAKLAGKPADAPVVGDDRRSLHVPGSLRRSLTGADRFDLRKRVRRRGRPGSARLLARTDRVGPGLASGVRDVRDARARAFLRRDRTGDQGGMDRRAARRSAAARIRGDEGALRDPSPGSAADCGRSRTAHAEVDAMTVAARRLSMRRRGCCRSRRWPSLRIDPSANAHEARPAYLELTETLPDRYDVVWRTPVLAGHAAAGRSAASPMVQATSSNPGCASSPTRSSNAGSSPCRAASAASASSSSGLQATITDVLVRVQTRDGAHSTTLVHPSQPWVGDRRRPRIVRRRGRVPHARHRAHPASATTICCSCSRSS